MQVMSRFSRGARVLLQVLSIPQVAFNLVFTVGGATNVSGAVLCGVLVDSCGPRGGILTGLVLIMAAWMPKVWAALDSKWTYSLVIKPDNGNFLGALSHR